MQKKEYSKDGLTVVWQPDLCIHSAKCVQQLPDVFKPREKPWVQLEGAEVPAIETAVKGCPSGALTIKKADEVPAPAAPEVPVFHKVNVLPNGPLRVVGACQVTLSDGSVVEKPNGVSFCRCGGSTKLPFCDGSHKDNGYAG